MLTMFDALIIVLTLREEKRQRGVLTGTCDECFRPLSDGWWSLPPSVGAFSIAGSCPPSRCPALSAAETQPHPGQSVYHG